MLPKAAVFSDKLLHKAKIKGFFHNSQFNTQVLRKKGSRGSRQFSSDCCRLYNVK